MGNLPHMVTNPELELAYEYISQTGRNVFLTGKAGTGKTTFLHRIKEEVSKRMAVVAPTGVAAINAKGVTIHSLFQLPFGVILPNQESTTRQRAFSGKKIDLIKSLDLIVIDEISMVRADVLDAIDVVLRRYRNPNLPFGGLQLLMIGDLHQLPPVVRPEDWNQLRDHYDTPYFFGSLALKKAVPTVIQLKHIYRQSDDVFINLLNKVRNNQLNAEVLKELNERYDPEFADEDGYITLTSHNKSADRINEEKLTAIKTQEYNFAAKIENNFPASMYPNHAIITFKVGAQVMFNKNDSYPDRLFYNGKIGTITGINVAAECIKVECPNEPPIDVFPATWENRVFELNEKTKEIEEKIIGTYEQHPLKLAWAITIHKSQGLTFENVIIDAQAAFAHGQVYVALSRCKSFEGIVLRTPIDLTSVRTDTVVKNYSTVAEQNQPTVTDLHRDKHAYQADCLRELFNFNYVERAARWLHRGLLENEKSIQGDAFESYNGFLKLMDEELVLIGNKFLPHLELYFRNATLPSENPELTARLEGAAPYFIELLSKKLLPEIKEFSVITDNKGVDEAIKKRVQSLHHLLYVKQRVFMAVDAGFDTGSYVKARADADIDFQKLSGGDQKPNLTKVPKNIENKELYLKLVTWRQRVAQAETVSAFTVISNKAMLEMVKVLPTSKASLLRIGGFGKTRCDKYGKEVLEIIDKYLEENDVKSDLLIHATKAKPKKDTKLVSLELYQVGKSLPEIAKERELKETTIFTHLAHWALEGSIEVSDILDSATSAVLLPYFQGKPDLTLKEVHDKFGGKYGFAELRLVRDMVELETSNP